MNTFEYQGVEFKCGLDIYWPKMWWVKHRSTGARFWFCAKDFEAAKAKFIKRCERQPAWFAAYFNPAYEALTGAE